MILVTGVTGFIGKYLLISLIKTYGRENIIALTSKPLTDCHYLLHNNYEFNSDYFVNNSFKNIKTIIHAGSFTPKDGSQANDLNGSNSNIFSTSKLISAIYPNLERVVFLSTLDVYGYEEIISEESKVHPVSLYGDSKFYCERMIHTWANKNDLIYQILRIGHVYGPGEEAYHKIIPLTMRKLINHETLQIWGTGEDIRSFIYIDDVVSAIIESLELKQPLGPINIVGKRSISIKELVLKLIQISGFDTRVEYLPSLSPQRNLRFDTSKMEKYLLKKEYILEEGLKKEWIYMKDRT